MFILKIGVWLLFTGCRCCPVYLDGNWLWVEDCVGREDGYLGTPGYPPLIHYTRPTANRHKLSWHAHPLWHCGYYANTYCDTPLIDFIFIWYTFHGQSKHCSKWVINLVEICRFIVISPNLVSNYVVLILISLQSESCTPLPSIGCKQEPRSWFLQIILSLIIHIGHKIGKYWERRHSGKW